ncbi:choice-of-anchor D domain-containing protein [candidate division KSB1 bacterium]
MLWQRPCPSAMAGNTESGRSGTIIHAAIIIIALILSTGRVPVLAQSSTPEIQIFYTGKPDPLDMGFAAVGDTSIVTFLLTNPGASVLSGYVRHDNPSISIPDSLFDIVFYTSDVIEVFFIPQYFGDIIDTLVIVSNDPINSILRVPVAGRGVESAITVEDSTMDFGSTSITVPVSKRLPFLNTSLVNLRVFSIEQADSAAGIFTLSQTSEVTAPGDSSGIFVTFSPDSNVTYYDTLTIFSNAGNSPEQRIYLTGAGLAPKIEISADSLQFDSVRVSETESMSFIVSNTGSGLVTITGMATSTAVFNVNPGPIALQPESSVGVQVDFSPAAFAEYSDSVTITTDHPNDPLRIVYLKGKGMTPVIGLTGASLSFDSVRVSTTRTLRDTVYNTGNEPLEIIAVSLSDPVYTTTLQEGTVVQPGDSLGFEVQFAPGQTGLVSGSMIIQTNDAVTPSRTIVLSGTGKEPDISVAPSPLAFGSTGIGVPISEDLTVTDTGTDTLQITGITFLSPVFSVVSTTHEIAPGASKDITVQFTPAANQAYIDTMTLFTNVTAAPEVKVPVTANPAQNIAPTITSTPPDTINENSLLTYQVTVNDPDGVRHVFELLTSPGDMGIDSLSGLVRWQPDQPDTGVNPISIRVKDEFNAVDTQNFNLVVVEENDPPAVTSTPVLSHHVDSLYTYQLTFNDEEGDPSTARLLVFPSSPTLMTMSGSNLITWTPTAVGKFPVLVRLTDTTTGRVTNHSFTITVTPDRAPEISGLSAATAVQNTPYTGFVVAEDWENDLLAYTLIEAPEGMSIDPLTGQLSWTPGSGDTGVNLITVRVEDGKGNTGEAELTLSVTDVNDPPVISGIGDTTLVEDIPARLTFTIDDPDENEIFTVSDNTALFDADASGVIEFTPENDHVGSHDIRIAVSDGALTDTLRFTLVIENVNDPPVFRVQADTVAFVGKAIELQLTADDDDGGQLVYAAVRKPADAELDSQSGLFRWTPNEFMQGVRSVVVRAADPAGAADTLSFIISVTRENRPPVAYLLPSFVFNEDETFRLSIRRVGYDVDNSAEELTWTITGGDSITVAVSDSTALFSAPQDWNGSEPFEIVLRDPGGLADTLLTTMTVRPVNDPPQLLFVSPAADTTIDETAGLVFEFTAGDADRDTLDAAWYLDGDSVSVEKTYSFSAADHGPGRFGLRLAVTDRSDTVSAFWNVTVRPNVTGIGTAAAPPEDYRLDPAYPNPFNSSVVIRFAVPETAPVSITIYNIRGEAVAAVLDERLPAGVHTVRWNGVNGSGVPAATGWYLVSMRTPKASLSRPIVLIR